MANSERRYYNNKGETFVPMNVEGNQYEDKFMTTKKMIFIVADLVVAVFFAIYLNSIYAKAYTYIVCYLSWFVATMYMTRFIVFEEKFYYRMYKETNGRELRTPGDAWDVASIDDTNNGAILTYAEGKIGVCLAVEKDTIVGKDNSFKEDHYDAISDFYRYLLTHGYRFVQMNLMLPIKNDKRVAELDKLVGMSTNQNSRKLIEYQVGYIKNIAANSYCDTDAWLIYSNSISKIDDILEEVNEAASLLMDGAFCDYHILDKKEIADMNKNDCNVIYFNINDAALSIFNGNVNSDSVAPLKLHSITWQNGENQKLSSDDITKLNKIANKAIDENRVITDYTIKRAIYKEDINKKFKVEFDELGKGLDEINSNSDDDYIDLD